MDSHPQTRHPQGGGATADAGGDTRRRFGLSGFRTGHFPVFIPLGRHQFQRHRHPALLRHGRGKNLLCPPQNQQGDDLPPLGAVESDYRQIRQIRPCGRRLYFPDTRPPHTQDRATDLRPSAQGAETREQGPARVEPIIGAENRTDYLCRSAHVRNGLEAFGSEYCHHFRIAGTFRFIHHSNLFGFFREQPNRRGYAKLAMTKIRTDFSEGS